MTSRHRWMIHQKYDMKTRIIKLRSCLIVAKQCLNGGSKINEGKEEGGREDCKEVKEGMGPLQFSILSLLLSSLLRVTRKSIIEGNMNSWSDVTATSCSSLFVKRLMRKPSHFTSISFVTSFKWIRCSSADNKEQQQTLTERRVDDAAKSLLIDVPF